MRKKFVIYISVLILLIAGYIAVTKVSEDTGEEETNIFNLLEGFEINSVDVENSYGKYSLTYNNSGWMLDEAKAEDEYITRLSQISSNLKLSSTELNDFGLENPVSRVTLTDKDGDTRSLLIGDLVSDKTGRYVMMDEIYVISNEYISWLLESKDILRNRNLYSEDSPVKVEYNGICFEIIDGVWQMTSPYYHQVRGAELNTEVLKNLHFTAVDFTDKSPAMCGLATPEGYISVWNSENEKTTIYFGYRENGLIYAMREGEYEICRIESPGFLDKEPKFFLNTLCYVRNIDEIDNIQVNEVFFDISDEGYKKNGKVIGKEEFIEFYKKLMGMTLIDEALNPVKDKLLLRMKVNFKNGTSDTVEVFQYKDRYGAVFINGTCTFYTLGEMVEEIVLRAEKM